MVNNKPSIKQVSCPTCGKQVEWSEKFPRRPFCSDRCRIIDLGDWAAENNKIPSDTPADFLNNDSEDNQ